MARRIAAQATTLAALALSSSASAFSSGPPGGYNGSPASFGATCTACHSDDGAGVGLVQILGVPAQYRLGAAYDITVRIEDPDRVGAGFQLSVETADGTHVGELVVIDPANTDFAFDSMSFIGHNLDGVANSIANWAALGDAAEYQVRWIAPASAVEDVRVYAAGNATNNNNSPVGEHVYTASVPSEPPSICATDLDGDGLTAGSDLAILLGQWGPNPGSADLDNDGDVDGADLATLLGQWGPCP